MSLYEKIIQKEESIAIIGLGYVGLPMAIAFAKKVKVIGYDIDKQKIGLYKKGIDPFHIVEENEIKDSSILFTFHSDILMQAKFHIIAVPTPINMDKTPNLLPIIKACETVGRNLTVGSIVVFESTVYPGVTEDICIPILEKESNLSCGHDFKVGYSPERIDPGNHTTHFDAIIKVVSAIDQESLEEIAAIYELAVKAGVHRVSSIKVAEATKVAENSQRDINIAFMNELAMVFDRMNINTKEVVDAMNTKWNALGFTPGLVGGHCIGVDPYYFIYQAENLGYHSQIIAAGRKINDTMGDFIADAAVKELIKTNHLVKESNVVIMGATFKENCTDIRNSKVIDIVKRLNEYQINPKIVDPCGDKKEFQREYGLELTDQSQVKNADCIIFAVAHEKFARMSMNEIERMFKGGCDKKNIIIDVKSIFPKEVLEKSSFDYWQL